MKVQFLLSFLFILNANYNNCASIIEENTKKIAEDDIYLVTKYATTHFPEVLANIISEYVKFNSKATKDLFDAVINDDLNKTKEAILQGANINAIQKFNVDEVEYKNCESPLHIAIKMNFNEIVIFLLISGAKINIVNDLGMTPLHYSIIFENLDIVKKLIEFGADVNYKEKKCGFTPLHFALQSKNIGIFQYLIQSAKANYLIPDNNGNTVFYMAVKNKINDFAKFIYNFSIYNGLQELIPSNI